MLYIEPRIFAEIASLLTPHVRTQSARSALITPLFSSHQGLYSRIDWSGDALSFSVRLVELMTTYGQIAPDRHALIVLLEGLRSSVGIGEQQRIEVLIDALKESTLCDSPNSEQEAEVFLCYSSQDKISAQNLREALTQAGISVWQDQDRIEAGAFFSIQIEQAIRRSHAVIVLVTQAARESKWVRNEILFALDVQKTVIPLLLQEDVSRMVEIYGVQHIHMYTDWKTGLDTLVQCLRRLVPAESKAIPTTQPSPLPGVSATATPKQAGENVDPFIYGTAVPPEMFVGREEIRDVIKGRVGHYYTLQSLSIVANRHMGKTSLLRYVSQNCQELFPSEYDYAAVYIDAMDPRAHTSQGFMRILRRNTKSQLGHELWPEKDDGKLTILNESLEDLAVYDGVRLVLLLDEWESVMAYQGMDALLEALKSIGSRGIIGMITATAYLLTDLKEQGKLTSPFPIIFKSVYLGNMPRSEWVELIREGFARSGMTPGEFDYALVGELAGGHPYLTQLAGSLIWQARHKDWDEAGIRTAFKQEAQMIFSSIWQRLSPDQVQAIKMALGLGERAQVADSVLNDLKSRGVITEGGGVFCNPFADFVLQELER
jgi:hypothetical protein